MRKARVDLQRTLLQKLDRHMCGSANWHDLVIVAMHHERRNVDRLEVFGKVRFRERLYAFIMRVHGAHHALAPPIADHTFRHFRSGPIESVERTRREVQEKLRTAVGLRLAEAVEHLKWQAAW